MARETLTVQQMTRAGLAVAFTAAIADGHQFLNDGYTFLRVKTTGTPAIITVQHPGTVDGQSVSDVTVSLGATAEQDIGPFPARFNQGATNRVYVDYSAITGVTIAAVTIRQ